MIASMKFQKKENYRKSQLIFDISHFFLNFMEATILAIIVFVQPEQRVRILICIKIRNHWEYHWYESWYKPSKKYILNIVVIVMIDQLAELGETSYHSFEKCCMYTIHSGQCPYLSGITNCFTRHLFFECYEHQCDCCMTQRPQIKHSVLGDGGLRYERPINKWINK